MTETAIIGDIHGCTSALDALVADARPRASRLVFLGDYVNRGPDSRGVIERLLHLRGDGADCTFLAGNHDAAFARALDGSFDAFLTLGGAATVRSYTDPPYADVANEFQIAVPDAHRRFLHSLEDSYTADGLYAAHVLNDGEGAGMYRVSGHSPQDGSVPVITDDEAFIDTGCGTTRDGKLTCLFWPSLTWLSYPAS